MLQVPRKRRPPDGSHLEAWTLSLVIDFWRRDAPVSQTPGTLQEDDLVLKKCIQETNISMKMHFYNNTTLNYKQILPHRRL